MRGRVHFHSSGLEEWCLARNLILGAREYPSACIHLPTPSRHQLRHPMYYPAFKVLHGIKPRDALVWVPTALAMAFVVWFFHWTVRTSGGFGTPGEEDYYNFLVRGWRQGHLHMSKEPSPAMLALTDPYDPNQNRDVRLADASYFKGHYYLYFGAAPALVLMLPYDLITGRELGTTTAIFVYCVIGYMAACGLWLMIRARYYQNSSAWVGWLGVLVIGLGTHVLALERRPLVWELPISIGFAFSTLALCGIYAAMHGRRPVLSFAAAGFCLGLAVGARPTCLLGAVMFAPPIWQMWRHAHLRQQTIRCCAALACGMGIWLLAILAHNFARFGNPLELGQNYQLSGAYESRVRHFSITYIPHNAYVYFFHPGAWSPKFPFVSVSPVTGGPSGYLGEWSEAVCGLGVTFPFVWMALALPMGWRSRADGWRLRGILGALAAFCLVMCLAILAYFVATPRYLADFAPTLGLIALCGWLELERWARNARWNKVVAPLTAAACISTAAAGILVSFDYHGGSLHRLSPHEWETMRDFFSGFGR